MEDYLSLQDFAQKMYVDKNTVLQWIKNGHIQPSDLAIRSNAIVHEKMLHYDEEDADVVMEPEWEIDGQGRMFRNVHRTKELLHRLIAQRMLEYPLGKTPVHFRDGNPLNVKRENLQIGNAITYEQKGDKLYFPVGVYTARISLEDKELLEGDVWIAQVSQGKIQTVYRKFERGSLREHVAVRMLGRPLKRFEKATFKDQDPLHCERENIEIRYNTHLSSRDFTYDKEDRDLITRYTWKIVKEKDQYVVKNTSGEYLTRLVLSRKLGRDLLPCEIVKQHDPSLADVRRSNLYSNEGV